MEGNDQEAENTNNVPEQPTKSLVLSGQSFVYVFGGLLAANFASILTLTEVLAGFDFDYEMILESWHDPIGSSADSLPIIQLISAFLYTLAMCLHAVAAPLNAWLVYALHRRSDVIFNSELVNSVIDRLTYPSILLTLGGIIIHLLATNIVAAVVFSIALSYVFKLHLALITDGSPKRQALLLQSKRKQIELGDKSRAPSIGKEKTGDEISPTEEDRREFDREEYLARIQRLEDLLAEMKRHKDH